MRWTLGETARGREGGREGGRERETEGDRQIAHARVCGHGGLDFGVERHVDTRYQMSIPSYIYYIQSTI
jgi:hypothetical protein